MMQKNIIKEITLIFKNNKITSDPNAAYDKLKKYVQLIIDKNKVMNLTGFNELDIWKKGVLESLITMNAILQSTSNTNIKMLDVGAGVGFPSIPLKIIMPNIKLSIIESNKKRCEFLKLVGTLLNFEINITSERIEESTKYDYYNLVIGRAVAPLFKLIEISHHIMKIGGEAFWIKGKNVDTEIINSEKIVNKLKIKIEKIKINSKLLSYDCYLIKYNKTMKTPVGIPRSWARIA